MLTPRERRKLEKHVHGIDVGRLSQTFEALGEPNRCLLFRALLKGENATVGDMAQVVGISLPLASQHLKILLQANLLTKSKQGKHVYYVVNNRDPLVAALKQAVEG